MKFIQLFQKLDVALGEIDSDSGLSHRLSDFLDRLVTEFCDDLGLIGGRLYERNDDGYAIVHAYPACRERIGRQVALDYPPVESLRQAKYVLYQPGDAGLDPEFEDSLGVETFAAIILGEDAPHLMAFSLRPDADYEEILYTLQTIRHVINQNLRRERLVDRVAQVREIQRSLLPKTNPVFHDFDICGRSVAAEEVGGDLFDFQQMHDRSLGVALVDSAGHGLPAALQARDAIIGLRMGIREDMRIASLISKLNSVVAGAGLASKFIALVYGELESNGNFVYCNAGHAAPLLLQNGRIERLEVGGRVLGPIEGAQYERGFVYLAPGDLLLLFTDGLSEAMNPAGEEFGEERLRALMRQKGVEARTLVENIFDAVRTFSGLEVPVDDQTCVVVRRRPTY
jgi:hypothetical protein